MINKQRLIKLLQKLISINSENPGGDESRIASYVRGYLKNLGLKTTIYEFKKNRSNIVAVLKGSNQRHSLLLTPHLDTVPVGKNWRFGAFAGKIQKNKIYGLGATDCKGNLACALEAINSLVEDKAVLGYNLILAATADEENGSELGIIPLLNKGILKPSAAVVLDADDFSIIVAQKGLLHLKVKIWGKRAHGAYPWLGVNAIAAAVEIIQELKRRKKLSFPKNKYLKPPTCNIGTIKGGDKVNVVADYCEFELDFRFLPYSGEKEILNWLKNRCVKYAKKFQIEIEGLQRPYLIDEKHQLVNSFVQAMKRLGAKPRVTGSEGATVITFFQDKNIPAIATGFGAEGCNHVTDEYAKISNLYSGAQILEDFLKKYKF